MGRLRDVCWVCGKRRSTGAMYGYPVCDECEVEDPEGMEEVIIKFFETGEFKPYNALRRESANK